MNKLVFALVALFAVPAFAEGEAAKPSAEEAAKDKLKGAGGKLAKKGKKAKKAAAEAKAAEEAAKPAEAGAPASGK